MDYAAKTVSEGTKRAAEGIKSVGQSHEEKTDETSKEGPEEENTNPSRKFKFHFNSVNFGLLKKLKLEKIKAIGAPFKKQPKIALLVLAFVLVVVFAVFKVAQPNGAVSNGIGNITSSTNSSAKIDVNRRFEVPIKNKDGSETGEKLGITITTIEKTNEILIKNSPAKTKNGKIFLVLSMEIQNDTKKQLTVKPVDMVRLIGDDGRSYAPDVHNNEVSAEPVSLRKTRVGYVVDGSKNSFKLLVGEVRGQQEPIEVSF